MSLKMQYMYFYFVLVLSPTCSFWFDLDYDICSHCTVDSRFCREFLDAIGSWCYCDDLCPYFDDCCKNSTLLPAPATVSWSDLTWFEKLVCEEVHNHLMPNISLWMITSCDVEWKDDDIRQRCEVRNGGSPSEEIQVIFTTETDVTFVFRNIYCALCNGVQETTPLRLEIYSFENCDVFRFRENLRHMSYIEAMNIFLSENCTYYQSTYGMEKMHEIRRRCGTYQDNGFIFDEGLGSLFDFLPDKKDTSYEASYSEKSEDVCPRYAYQVENKCRNFSLSPHEKFVSYLFEIEGHVELSEIEIYAKAFLEFVERSFRAEVSLASVYQSLILNWALTVDHGFKSQVPCTIVHLDAFLYHPYISIFTEDLVKYPCFTNQCENGHIPMSRPVEKTDCKIHPTKQFLDFSISLENKLSIASSAVSVITLVPSIIFCAKCPLYHNLPGRNSLSLMINLFIAHVLFLSGVPLKSKSMECVVIGILLHWSWLAVFVWMSVCSFHTWFTFSMYGFVKLKYANDKRVAFRAYNVIGYGVPSLITGVCVALHFLCPTCKFDYGTVSCFISNPTMLGVAFAAPCGFLLMMNMIFFAMMIRNVQNLPRIRTNELSMNRNNIVVYLKLSLLIGFTWILSFVAEIVQLKWVLYLSILINGSQGLHLFWSHVCNKRAIDYLRGGSLAKDKSSDHDTESTTTRHKITKL